MKKLKVKKSGKEVYELIQTKDDFAFWITEMGWESEAEFTAITGVTFEDCENKWCYLCGNRVFTM